MTFAIRVAGGTGAGRKRPLQEALKGIWTCECTSVLNPVTHPPYLNRCSDCGTKRPCATSS